MQGRPVAALEAPSVAPDHGHDEPAEAAGLEAAAEGAEGELMHAQAVSRDLAAVAQRGRGKLGRLQAVPPVSPPKEHLASAIKRTMRVMYASGIKSDAERERNRAARQMDTLMKELSVPLTRYLAGLPDVRKLHPFERALLQLTVGEANYHTVITKVDTLRKSIQETGKSYAARASKATNKAGAVQVATEGLEHLTNLYTASFRSIETLRVVVRKLRSLPLVDVELPTIALVGAPNVGKSSLVKLLSSGTPEVCNYPFTTRSIKMGHFYVDARKHQVTDTPGLLNRVDGERNKMEMLTLAVLQFLPTSILFVIDLTEECGTSVADQWAIRAELAQRFPNKPWVDVLSKSDVIQGILEDGAELRERSGAAAEAPGGGAEAPAPAPAPALLREGDAAIGPEEVVARLGGALAVSSLTGHGVPELKEHIMAALLVHYAQQGQGPWQEEEEGALGGGDDDAALDEGGAGLDAELEGKEADVRPLL